MTKYEKEFVLPGPDAPLEERVKSALALTIMMPLLWPAMALMFGAVWLLMGVVILMMCFMIPLMPIFALMGFESTEEE